jgi:site-specific recombinase XerD
MMEFTGLREKVIISLCSSSGIRIGAFPGLKWGDLEPITVPEHNIYICMIKVYAGNKEKYKTFCTPQCRKYIDEYISYRKRYGVEITKESPLYDKSLTFRIRPP